MPERLVHKADFERLLAVRATTRSAHFALHHVHGAPSTPKRPGQKADQEKLYTGQSPARSGLVDNFTEPALTTLRDQLVSAESKPGDATLPENLLSTPSLQGCWLGCVVPKRHAKRAVTRNLIKRQIRSAFERHATTLQAGLWLVRLHQGFPVAQFVSAKSDALAAAARAELDALLARAA